MAKTKMGVIVTDMRGALGGHVFTKNRGGASIRTKVTPANGQTVAQQAVRNRFATFSQGWRGLTQDQRDAWNASVGSYSRTDIFGDIRNPSGINLYQRLNNLISQVSGIALTEPPLPSSVPEIVISGFTFAVAVPAMSASFNGPVADDSAVIVSATAPLSPGKSFVKSEFRVISVLAPAAASPANLLAAYVAKFGNTGAVGQKIVVKFQSVNKLTGQVGSASVASAISVA